MSGEMHRDRQSILGGLLGAQCVRGFQELISSGCREFLRDWRTDSTMPLLCEMRGLARGIASRWLFGNGPAALEVGCQIQEFFHLRREYAGGKEVVREGTTRALIENGERLDRALRNHLRLLGTEAASESSCFMSRLLRLTSARRDDVTEDDLIAHVNVLFMSSSEPVAVALTWAFLLLSQVQTVRARLREGIQRAFVTDEVPTLDEVEKAKCLDWVVREALRLFPPNAIMVRLTNRQTSVAGHALPARCEVMLSPYVSHREPVRFPKPDAFMPDRWDVVRPSPFEYLPFGGGSRYCLGKTIAVYTLKAAIASVLRSYDIILDGDQAIDWKMSVTMMPSNEPMIRAVPLWNSQRRCVSGRLRGDVAGMVCFNAETD